MSKHTPGPWVAVFKRASAAAWIQQPGKPYGDLFVAYCDSGEVSPEENRANAHLIAAAPEMLEALYMVRDADEDCRKDGFVTIPSAARAKIDAAIAKAEGQS